MSKPALYRSDPKRPGLVDLGMRASHLKCRRTILDMGLGLPSNVLLDGFLNDPNLINEHNGIDGYCFSLASEFFPTYARELLVHPKRGDSFRKGKDIVDSRSGWILPAEYVPMESVGREGAALFVDPKHITEGKTIVVHPESLTVIQLPSHYVEILKAYDGILDKQTCIPVDCTTEELRASHNTIRLLYLDEDATRIAPIMRGLYTESGLVHQVIFADRHPDAEYYVIGVETFGTMSEDVPTNQNTAQETLAEDDAPNMLKKLFAWLGQLRKTSQN